jgi:hypothetical protein
MAFLVMTPASVQSPWVQREVNAALNEVTAQRMLGVIPFVMLPTAEKHIPILWHPLHRYNAARGYEPAREASSLLLHSARRMPNGATTSSPGISL